MNGAKNSTAIGTTDTVDPSGEAAYVGRFAPTPSGDLHLGSLYTAVASYLDARAHGGRWLLRMEDLDRPREVPGSAHGIVHTLEQFGFEWDGPIVNQSERVQFYQDAISDLRSRRLTFECLCSRRQLEDEDRYPGTCRDLATVERSDTATRLRVDAGQIYFTDRIQGIFRQNVGGVVGDIVLQRRDRIFAYVLAVVVDDAQQGITHVVRGADLLDNTPRQIYLQRQLGLSAPAYAHVPIVVEADGSKLAKSRRSMRLAANSPVPQLLTACALLGLSPPKHLSTARLDEVWAWAIECWQVSRVPRHLKVHAGS